MAMFQPLSVALGASTSAAAIRAATAQPFSNRVAYGVGGDAGLTGTGTYLFTVPAGITLLKARFWGASGGSGSNGGPGGFMEVDIPVTPGEVLTLVIPTAGSNSAAGSPGGGAPGYLGDGGGGYAVIRRGSTDLAIAAGGGGIGDVGLGGAGGPATGGDGVAAGTLGGSYGGLGGTQSAGGANGNSGGTTSGQYQGANYYQGGAGGGGYYGGGSGALQSGVGRGGGGGGSNWYNSALVSLVSNLRGDAAAVTANVDYAGTAGRAGNAGRIVLRY
ncbi:glycine-rich protein [Azospirillum thiophilum]|uniref:glycine-rich protein n=1 Tax=Azospirillum thiophilum TaxID=528244 RepID=UPI0006985AC5|nr:glycine-rich protein [Azospirillum thiophilum]